MGLPPGASWDPNLTLMVTLTIALNLHLALSLTLTLYLTSTLARTPNSALEEDHETGVALALATSLDQMLTVAQALST